MCTHVTEEMTNPIVLGLTETDLQRPEIKSLFFSTGTSRAEADSSRVILSSYNNALLRINNRVKKDNVQLYFRFGLKTELGALVSQFINIF